MFNKSLFSSKTPEWETPQELFDELDKEFSFQVDVCATKENAKCKDFFDEKRDGLSINWWDYKTGFKWMNPPYGREISKWVEKASRELRVVSLLPARTDTKWFHDYIWDRYENKPRENVEIRFIKGRLKFGGSKNSAPFPSMIVIFN